MHSFMTSWDKVIFDSFGLDKKIATKEEQESERVVVGGGGERDIER